MQSFVLDSTLNPFNVVEPGKKPRVTLTPTLAMKDGKPFLAFAVQGGDTQDQNLLQFFLDIVDFGMTVQEATEAPNINTDQLYLSLGGTKMEDRKPKPGYILLNENTPDYIRKDLKRMGYTLSFEERTSGPINAIYFDWKHGTLWGGSSNHGFFVLTADANHDGTVDTIDFNILAANFSQAGASRSVGDFDYNGTVDTIDFNLLAANFSKTLFSRRLIESIGLARLVED